MKNLQSNNYSFNRNQSIDFLKGICILFVIITHFSWSQSQRLDLGFPFWIDMAVPIFMIISGYVNSMSYSRKNITKYSQAYEIKNWLKSFIRYTFPYLIIFAIEVILQIILNASGGGKPWHAFLISFFCGGWGPGSYYYPIMVQFIFIFPIIFILIKKFGWKGLVYCFLMNLLWELITASWALIPSSTPEKIYRLVIFRYIFLIAIGCYTALYRFSSERARIFSIVGSGIGALFLVLTQYTSYKSIVFNYWTTTSLLAVLLIIPFACMVILNKNSLSNLCKPIVFLGRASYNIFFVQMVYFYFVASSMESLIVVRWLTLLIDVLVCVTVGLLFYFIETPITKKLIMKINEYKKSS